MGKHVQRIMVVTSASLMMGELICVKKVGQASVCNTYAHSPIWRTMKEISALDVSVRVV